MRLLVFGRLVPGDASSHCSATCSSSALASDVRALPNPVTRGVGARAARCPAALYLLFCAIPVLIYVGRPGAARA